MESSWTGLRLESTPLQNGAGETNFRYGSFSSFRRKPESSSIKDKIRCLYNYDLFSKTQSLTGEGWGEGGVGEEIGHSGYIDDAFYLR
jgi:hypothetical protein